MADDELIAFEAVLLAEMGAGESVGAIPLGTLQSLCPEAFPLSATLRELLLKNPCLAIDHELMRFVFNISAVSNAYFLEKPEDNWKDDPFYHALSAFDNKDVTGYLKVEDTYMRALAKLERFELLAAEVNEVARQIQSCFLTSGKHFAYPQWEPIRDTHQILIFRSVKSMLLLPLAQYEKPSLNLLLWWRRRRVQKISREVLKRLNEVMETHHPHLMVGSKQNA